MTNEMLMSSTDIISASGNNTDHLIYIITGSVIGSAMLLVHGLWLLHCCNDLLLQEERYFKSS